MLRCSALAALAGLLLASPFAHGLQPEEIALVVARGNRESMGLARYYCRQRGVPAEHVIEIDVPPEQESIDRETWRWAIRPEIRDWLTKNDPQRQLRCLVTTWGTPLKIQKEKPTDASRAYNDFLRREIESRYGKLEQVIEALDKLGEGAPLSSPDEAQPAGQKDRLKAIQAKLEASLKSAQRRLNALPGEQRRQLEPLLQQLATATGGARVLLQGINRSIQAMQADEQTPTPALLERFHLLRGRSSAFTELRLLIDTQPPGYARDSLTLRMLEQTGGLLATIEWLEEQAKTAKRNQTSSSFDSELSLVLWDDGYELLRWQPNYLRPNYESSELPGSFPTLMVSRLDGPTLAIAKRLIDDAIATEQAGGLQGKAYLDARGLAELLGPPLEPGSYPDFDRSLLITAKGLESLKTPAGEPRFEVVLDDESQLFMPGQCPDAGLYCGWYSLAKYVDAFDWNRGAVAYHLASAEATTLKELDSQAWCKKLLEDGVCATIGPAFEPYLLAFPRPNEFFALLVQGDKTLVEVYYQTKPFNSWAMLLIGDPLYRPFPAKTTD